MKEVRKEGRKEGGREGRKEGGREKKEVRMEGGGFRTKLSSFNICKTKYL